MKRRSWRKVEKNYIIDNYAIKTTEEMCVELDRDRKSVNRMIERLREEGLIGYRDQDTVDRAYKQRSNSKASSRRGRRRKSLSYADEVEEV